MAAAHQSRIQQPESLKVHFDSIESVKALTPDKARALTLGTRKQAEPH